MLKLTKTIVDGKRALIGFLVSGKEKEFGGFSNNMIERGIPVSNLIKEKFSNNQISTVNGKIVERNKFKINELPMVVYVNDNYVEVDNTVNLIGRFVQDNENIGFRVKFADGSEENLKYANVIMLCKWFKPGNFSIRTSSLSKQYICGKKGGPNLDDLPATIIGETPKATPKRTKSAAKETKPEFNGAIESGFDILDIYGFIKDCNGCIIKLPGEQYEAATEDGETITEGFTSLGIGEVASPTPMFNATKINVNAGFKKVGFVPVTLNGNTQNITTFVYRTKSIFLNGENYIKKFGIAVPTNNEEELIKKLGRSLALEKITDSAITSPLGQVIDAKSLAFYKVDTSKLDVISEKKRTESILTTKQIINTCKKMYELKLISKAVGPKGGIMKNFKDSLGETEVAKAKNKKLHGLFSMMSPEALNAISASGIDLYSGAYTIAGTPYAKKSGTVSEEDKVEIEYILKGYEASKLTGAKVLDAVRDNDSTKVPESVIKAVNKVLSITDFYKQYNEANKLYELTEKKIAELNKILWMHNASMYLNGNKQLIHTHDSKNWIPDTSSRVKNSKVYMCKSKGAEGLTVKFNGVEI